MTGAAWYAAEDQLKNVREIVVEITAPRPAASRFGRLMLDERYQTLTKTFWGIDLIRLESDPDPTLLLRADGQTTRFRQQSFRVAFCFYRMQAGGLFALFLDFPALPAPKGSSLPCALFEWICGIDLDDECQRIGDAIARSPLRVCFAEGEGPGEGLGCGLWRDGAIDALYDVPVGLDPVCCDALQREWTALLDDHAALAGGGRDFAASVRQFQAANPLSRNPIIDRPG